MKIKPMKQSNSLACGPTCIYLAAKYFGDKTSFKKIEELTDYKKKEGVTDEDIVSVLKKLGLETKKSINSSWEYLVSENTEDTILIGNLFTRKTLVLCRHLNSNSLTAGKS
jgi:ABC-type bacteriocin/lantibiotic exporter with double-glycine peptidase domain